VSGRQAGWNGRRAARSPARGIHVWIVAALCALAAAPAEAVTPLRTIVEDVPGSAGYRYGTRDNMGNSMDTLKIVKAAWGGYLGVYHTFAGGQYTAKVATSVDLLTWRFEANLASRASRPTIYRLSGGAAVIAYESDLGCAGAGTCLTVRYYSTESALLNGAASRTVVLPRHFSSCAEGTPSISSAAADLSTVSIGFHYARDCRTDRQARGTLRNFDPVTWDPSTAASLDNAILSQGASADGDIADRDGTFYDGSFQRLHEGQVASLAELSGRNFLLVGSSSARLSVITHGGSRGFANPTFTPLRLPSGQQGIVVTQFLPASEAAAGEAGELVYFRPQTPTAVRPDPAIAAAGDISCANVSCSDDETSKLLLADTPDKVLTLGDNQYEHGELENFWKYYAVDWGRVKSITMPTPGNHDPPSSGYTSYFEKPANYSWDLGDWHLVALDSTSISTATSFLDADLEQHPRRCILAYWHHPRFSSGGNHGNNTSIGPLWTLLYAAHADVVLVGHEHIYERFAPQTPSAEPSATGIRQFTVGTGGKALHSLGTVKANSEVRIAGRFGVLRMTLHPTSYDWRFVADDGSTLDSGSGNCV
jgi:acid phosphatase type 7